MNQLSKPLHPKVLKWSLPALNLDMLVLHMGVSIKIKKKKKKNRMANSVDPDETAHYEPSHLDRLCLQRYLFLSAGLKGLMLNVT